MKEKYRKLNLYYRVAIWTFLISLALFLFLIEMFFVKIAGRTWGEVPLGILLGGGLSALLSCFQGMVEKHEVENETSTLSIILIIARFALFAGLVIGNALLYYQANIKIFNLFGIVGGYTLGIITLVILMARNKE